MTSTVGHKFAHKPNDKLEPISSWTAFMKKVTHSKTMASFLDYLEVVPLPPKDNVSGIWILW